MLKLQQQVRVKSLNRLYYVLLSPSPFKITQDKWQNEYRSYKITLIPITYYSDRVTLVQIGGILIENDYIYGPKSELEKRNFI